MTTEPMYLVVAGLPIVAGLYRYASDLGYRNMSPRDAFEDAWRVSALVGLICCAGLIIHKFVYGW